MIRAEKLAVSRPMYAFDPATWLVSEENSIRRVDAIWFKRRSGVLTVTAGWYYPMVLRRDGGPAGNTYEAWIAAADDNRYGGKWSAKSDGEHCWFADARYRTADEDRAARARLSAALGGFPAVPAGFDGWWTFPK